MYVCLWMGSQRSDLIFDIFDRRQSVLRDPFVYFSVKTTERVVPTKTCETGREGRRMSVSQEWDLEVVSAKLSQTFQKLGVRL